MRDQNFSKGSVCRVAAPHLLSCASEEYPAYDMLEKQHCTIRKYPRDYSASAGNSTCDCSNSKTPVLEPHCAHTTETHDNLETKSQIPDWLKTICRAQRLERRFSPVSRASSQTEELSSEPEPVRSPLSLEQGA